MKKKLVIIASTIGATKSLERFLGARDWEVHCETDKDAAANIISSKSPDIVMLSTDLVSPEPSTLIKLLAQAMGFEIIYFQESASTLRTAKTRSALRYDLGTSINGSNFLRIMNRIHDDVSVRSPSRMVQNAEKPKVSERVEIKTLPPLKTSKPTVQAPAQRLAPPILAPASLTEIELSPDSVLLCETVSQATNRALASVVNGRAPRAESSHVEIGTNSLLLRVTSANFGGYLVCAFGSNEILDQSLINNLKAAIQSSLKNLGAIELNVETTNIKMCPTSRDKELRGASIFNHGAHHDEKTIEISFFINASAPVFGANSDDQMMLEVSCSALHSQKVLNFELFYHLPLNGRFVKLNHKNQAIDCFRLERLKDRVAKLHFRREDSQAVEQHIVTGFFRGEGTNLAEAS